MLHLRRAAAARPVVWNVLPRHACRAFPLREYSVFDKSLDYFKELAQKAMKSVEAGKRRMIESTLENLSIEEKEKLYAHKGLLDEDAVNKVKMETEVNTQQRFMEAAEAAKEAAEAAQVAKEAAEAAEAAELAVKAKMEAAAELERASRFSRGDGSGGRLVGYDDDDDSNQEMATAEVATAAAKQANNGKPPTDKSEGAAAAAAGPVEETPKSSKFKGVSWSKRRQKWKTQITADGKTKYLGHFDIEKEAARKYDEHAAELGRPLNLPSVSGPEETTKSPSLSVKEEEEEEDGGGGTSGGGGATSSGSASLEWDADAGRVVEVDPILGHLIGRLGSRRIYLMDVPALATIPVWEKQRVYRKERARRIADGVLSRHNKQLPGNSSSGASSSSSSSPSSSVATSKHHQGAVAVINNAPLLVPGVVALYEKSWGHEKDGITRLIKASQSKSNQERNEMGVGEDGGGERGNAAEAAAAQRRRYGIVDGQHRVGALKLLHDKGHHVGRVVVEVFTVSSEEEITALFCDINKAEPVKDVDLPFSGPGGGGGASAKERQILAGAIEALVPMYPDFFKESPKCKRPNIHEDSFRELLFKSKVVANVPCDSDEDLLTHLLMKNEELSAFSDEEWALMLQPTSAKSTRTGTTYVKGELSKYQASALAKARSKNFFLGLDFKWAEEFSDASDVE